MGAQRYRRHRVGAAGQKNNRHGRPDREGRRPKSDRQIALDALLKAIAEFRKFTDRKPPPDQSGHGRRWIGYLLWLLPRLSVRCKSFIMKSVHGEGIEPPTYWV
jgi:hypothetical protein